MRRPPLAGLAKDSANNERAGLSRGVGKAERRAMKRWIIRSFFVGLLLLLVLVWGLSYLYVAYVEYETRSLWKVESFTGYAKLEWRRYSGGGDFHDVDRGWLTSSYRYTSSSATNLHYLFRFDWLITSDHRGIIIP